MQPTTGVQNDLGSVPAYDVRDASRYVRVPESTLRAWFRGQDGFAAVFEPACQRPVTLSFFNLVEAHVLSAIRRMHKLPLQRVRSALNVLHDRYPGSRHPLIDREFRTDGVDLFVTELEGIANVSAPERLALKEILEAHVHRIEFGPTDLPKRLFPFITSSQDERDRRTVSIDPAISFGRRVIAGTGITTEIVGERYAAGDTIEELAADYRLKTHQIEDAIRSEFAVAA